MKLLVLLSSVPVESDKVLASLKSLRRSTLAGKAVYRGKLSRLDILMMNTGIGKVNAAHSATAAIENFPVGLIVNYGIGGAYPGSGLAP